MKGMLGKTEVCVIGVYTGPCAPRTSGLADTGGFWDLAG